MAQKNPKLRIHILLKDEDQDGNISQNISNLELDFDSFNTFDGVDSLLRVLSTHIQKEITLNEYILKINSMNDWIKLIDIQSFYYYISTSIHQEQDINWQILRKEPWEISMNEEEDILAANQVLNKPINIGPKDRIKCSVCQQYSVYQNDYNEKRWGQIYGPFMYSKNKYYVHLWCALWLPNVEISPNNRWVKVGAEVNRSKRWKCTYCNRGGAGLNCYVTKTCNNKYHYWCAKSVGCWIDVQGYAILCPRHKLTHQIPRKEKKKDSDKIMRKEGNENEKDLKCKICQLMCDQDKFVICAKCNFSFHEQCVGIVDNKKKDIIVNDENEEENDYICAACGH